MRRRRFELGAAAHDADERILVAKHELHVGVRRLRQHLEQIFLAERKLRKRHRVVAQADHEQRWRQHRR